MSFLVSAQMATYRVDLILALVISTIIHVLDLQ